MGLKTRQAKRRARRRLQYLLGKVSIVGLMYISKYFNGKPDHLPPGNYFHEIRDLTDYLKMSEDDVKNMLIDGHRKRNDFDRKKYKRMPKRPRQDNKDFVNVQQSGCYEANRNKIRYPKKNRKTAWKRFYKLFPHLKPQEE